MTVIDVYIDGACANNGQKTAKAGYGIYFGKDDPRNEHGPVIGKQSNNTGELTAFIRCMHILQKEIASKQSQICIHTDSEYVIKCATTYASKLEKANWQTTNGKTVPNLQLVQETYNLYKNAKHCVELHYIRAHTDNTDAHSLGNAEADMLANLALGKADIQHDKIVKLNIPFCNKDKAKTLGAKWNINGKYWYVNENDLSEELQQLTSVAASKSSATGEKKYIDINYSKKDKAKSYGARWDSNVKSWYFVEEDISAENKKALLSLVGLTAK
jgi:ribonuclease HI